MQHGAIWNEQRGMEKVTLPFLLSEEAKKEVPGIVNGCCFSLRSKHHDGMLWCSSRHANLHDFNQSINQSINMILQQ